MEQSPASSQVSQSTSPALNGSTEIQQFNRNSTNLAKKTSINYMYTYINNLSNLTKLNHINSTINSQYFLLHLYSEFKPGALGI